MRAVLLILKHSVRQFASPGSIEEPTCSSQQLFRGKRFFNEEESLFRIVHVRRGGFPGNEDQRNSGTVRSKRDCEIRSRHAWHPDVGDHQIDPAAPGMKNLQRFQSIASFKNLKVGALQDCFDVRADSRVIIYNQDQMAGDVVSYSVDHSRILQLPFQLIRPGRRRTIGVRYMTRKSHAEIATVVRGLHIETVAQENGTISEHLPTMK